MLRKKLPSAAASTNATSDSRQRFDARIDLHGHGRCRRRCRPARPSPSFSVPPRMDAAISDSAPSHRNFGGTTWPSRRGQGRQRARRMAARARADGPDRPEHFAHLSGPHRDLARKFGDAPALLSRARALELPRAGRAGPTAMRAGRSREGIAQGDVVVPRHGELPGLSRDLARHHARRRGRGAGQHQPRRRGAGCTRSASWRRAHVIVGATLAGAVAAIRPQLRRCTHAGCMARASTVFRGSTRTIGRVAGRHAAAAERAPPSLARPRALYLHLGHDRPAQGRQRQPSSG